MDYDWTRNLCTFFDEIVIEEYKERFGVSTFDDLCGYLWYTYGVYVIKDSNYKK